MLRLCLERPLQTLMYGCFMQSRGWEHAGSRIRNHLLVVGIEGEAVFRVGGESYTVRRGDLLLIPAGTYYSASTAARFHYYFLHLNAGALENADMPAQPMREGADERAFYLPETRYDCCFLEPFIRLGDHFERVLYMLSRCREYALAGTPAAKLLLDLRVTELLVEISELCAKRETAQSAYPDPLLRMLVWLQSSYAEQTTLTSLSERFGLSKTYIARLFRRYLNTTATNYINLLRLRHAAELLRLSQMNVSQIAVGVGFCNVYYFSRLFSRTYGISPSEYRRQHSL